MMGRWITGIESQHAAGHDMARRAGQEPLLIILCQQALERMGAGDGEVIGFTQIEAAEIAIDPADRQARGLAPGMVDHGGHRIQTGDLLAAAAERDRQPAGAAAEVEDARAAGLRQIQEELAVIVDAAILGVVAGAVVIFAAAHGGNGDILGRGHTRTRWTSVTGFLPWLAWTARRRAMRAASLID